MKPFAMIRCLTAGRLFAKAVAAIDPGHLFNENSLHIKPGSGTGIYVVQHVQHDPDPDIIEIIECGGCSILSSELSVCSLEVGAWQFICEADG